MRQQMNNPILEFSNAQCHQYWGFYLFDPS